MSNYQKLANALQNTVENYTPDVLYPKSAKIVNIYDDGTIDVSVKIGDDVLLNCKYLGTPKLNDEVLLIPIENDYNKAICVCNIIIEENIKYLKDLKDDKGNRLVTDELIEYWNSKADYKIVNSTENGLMSFEDKIKLDNIEENANHIIIDDELNIESENPVSNNIITEKFNSVDEEIKNIINSYYGICNTLGNDSNKIINVEGEFKLSIGTIIGVKFVNTNLVNNITLNVNGTGAYNIIVGDEIYTGNDVRITGINGSTIYYMFNGNFWIYMSNNNEDRLVRKIVLM